jgi:hypothetical protein
MWQSSGTTQGLPHLNGLLIRGLVIEIRDALVRTGMVTSRQCLFRNGKGMVKAAFPGWQSRQLRRLFRLGKSRDNPIITEKIQLPENDTITTHFPLEDMVGNREHFFTTLRFRKWRGIGRI